ncbi:MAG: AAA family ATPase [Dehalococcoidia bacterium]
MEAVELYDIVAEDPRLQEVLRRFVQAERAGRQKEYFLGLEWFEVQADARYLNSLVTRGLARVSFKSNKTTCYVLEDLELTDRVLRKLSGEDVGLDLTEPEERLPGDFLATLVGYDDLKEIVIRSLQAERPLHLLLIGPPASGKSILLSEVARLPRSYFALGGGSSKAGITELLAEQRPRYLIIDEIDKARSEDLSTLLSLMESGLVSITKGHRQEQVRMKTWVFAGGNSVKGIASELASRFHIVHMEPYTKEDFVVVAERVLTMRENTNAGIARLIATTVAQRSLDIRDVVKFRRAMQEQTAEEVDRVERLLGQRRMSVFQRVGGG